MTRIASSRDSLKPPATRGSVQNQLGLVLRKRGAKILSVRPTPEDYARWCEAHCHEDTPEQRFQYATRPPE